MSVTERVMAAGSWSVDLSPETPRRVLGAIDVEAAGFSQLVVLPVHLDPRAHTDATMLGHAIYSGIYRAQEGDLRLSGPGLPILLGDEDGKGDVFETDRTTTNGWLSQWVTALRPLSLSAGATYSPGGSYDGSFFLVTAREAFETICTYFDVEWVVRPDFKLDVGHPDDLYGETPGLIVLHNAGEGGRDFSRLSDGTVTPLIGVTTVDAGMDRDLEDYTTKVIWATEETVETTQTDIAITADDETVSGSTSVTERETVTTLTTATTAEANIPYGRPSDGGPVILDRHIAAKDEYGSSPSTLAAAQLARFAGPRRELYVAGTADIHHAATVGGYVYLYAPPVVSDAANALTYRAQRMTPVKTRLLGCTWPIRSGYGVYLRTYKDTDLTWTDLTNYVEWEGGDVQLEVGALPRQSR